MWVVVQHARLLRFPFLFHTTALFRISLERTIAVPSPFLDCVGCEVAPRASAGWWLNARAYTAILYLNDGWRPSHGGCLRLHSDGGQDAADAKDAPAFARDRLSIVYPPPACPSSSPSAPSPFLDVEPVAGRLVVFSSQRVRHEVLPVTEGGDDASRFALTLWVLDPDLPLGIEDTRAGRPLPAAGPM